MIQCVGVILVRQDGAALAQLRDNKSEIFNPNVWAICGGGANPGEDLKVAGARELFEETRYVVNPTKLQFLSRDEATTDTGLKIKHEYFWTSYDETQPIECYEGQEIRFLTPQECRSLPVAEGHRELLLKASMSLFSGHPERRG